MDLTTPPPGKLSDLIELAIADARKLDRTRYTPMWMTWHRPRNKDGKCMVCLAGGVIAGTLGCPTDVTIDIATGESADPESETISDAAWSRALWALDSARDGDWAAAFRGLHHRPPNNEMYDALRAIPIPACSEFNDWNTLDEHLESLASRARQLRELGL